MLHIKQTSWNPPISLIKDKKNPTAIVPKYQPNLKVSFQLTIPHYLQVPPKNNSSMYQLSRKFKPKKEIEEFYTETVS